MKYDASDEADLAQELSKFIDVTVPHAVWDHVFVLGEEVTAFHKMCLLAGIWDGLVWAAENAEEIKAYVQHIEKIEALRAASDDEFYKAQYEEDEGKVH